MFHRLAASLNIAYKWFPMFDLDQTFSSNILLHAQLFHRLATSANKASQSGKKQPIRNRIISAVIRTKRYMDSLWYVDQTLFARLAISCCMRQTRRRTKMFDRLAEALGDNVLDPNRSRKSRLHIQQLKRKRKPA